MHLLGHGVVLVLVVVLVASLGDEFLEGSVLHLAVQLVETGADGGGAVLDFLNILTHQFFHGLDQLLAGAGAVVGFGFRLDFGFGSCSLLRLLGVGGLFRRLGDRGFRRLGGGVRGFGCLGGNILSVRQGLFGGVLQVVGLFHLDGFLFVELLI